MTEPAGALTDGVHVFPVRVYYEDTDAGGVVYYANFLKYAERARTDLLRNLGVEQSRLAADRAIVFAVRHCSTDFLRPARLDDLLEVHTRILGVKGASVEAEQRVRRKGAELVRMTVRLACVSRSGAARAVRIPASLRASLEDLSNVSKRD